MEILVLSDSHGHTDCLHRAIRLHPSAKYVLFCGDGLRDFEQAATSFPERIFYAVRGNCDFFCTDCDAPDERLIVLENKRILMMHGHLHGVKGGIGAAVSYAEKQQADILLYGHTHRAEESTFSYHNTYVYTLNPGSIADGSYGLLQIRENGILMSHGNID